MCSENPEGYGDDDGATQLITAEPEFLVSEVSWGAGERERTLGGPHAGRFA